VSKPENAGKQAESRNFGFTNARDHRTWFIAEYHAKTAEMLKPQVNWTLPDGSSHRLYADCAIHTNGVWTFFNASEYLQRDASAPLLPSFQTNVLTMPEFTEKPTEIEDEIKISSYQSLRNSRRADIPLKVIYHHLRLNPNLPPADACWLLTKLHGRLAAPWTCLVVVLIAIPFGAASGRRNLFVGVAGSIFICFVYFIIQQVSLAMGSAGHLSGWLAAWLPNIIFGGAGLVLTARVR
jgi:lipopolysaccharide export LptBFGC system permease protein LptF